MTVFVAQVAFVRATTSAACAPMSAATSLMAACICMQGALESVCIFMQHDGTKEQHLQGGQGLVLVEAHGLLLQALRPPRLDGRRQPGQVCGWILIFQERNDPKQAPAPTTT
jgi:hypothetical protein